MPTRNSPDLSQPLKFFAFAKELRAAGWDITAHGPVLVGSRDDQILSLDMTNPDLARGSVGLPGSTEPLPFEVATQGCFRALLEAVQATSGRITSPVAVEASVLVAEAPVQSAPALRKPPIPEFLRRYIQST